MERARLCPTWLSATRSLGRCGEGGLASRAHRNALRIVAFANKLARIARAVLRRGERFAVTGMPVAA